MSIKYVSYDNLVLYDTEMKSFISGTYATKTSIPTKTSQLTNDSSFVVGGVAYSQAEKTKLAGVATGAQVNLIEGITVNGTTITPSAKNVNITVPTDNKTLNNGAGYQTATDVDAAIIAKSYQTAENVKTIIEGYSYQNATNVKSIVEGYKYQTAANVKSTIEDYGYQNSTQVNNAIANAVGKITSISYQVVTTLPSTGEVGVIYLIANGGATGNEYDEYIWLGSTDGFEKLGTRELDLSGYAKTADFVAMTTAEVDKLFA